MSPRVEQALRHVVADEAGRAGHENRHVSIVDPIELTVPPARSLSQPRFLPRVRDERPVPRHQLPQRAAVAYPQALPSNRIIGQRSPRIRRRGVGRRHRSAGGRDRTARACREPPLCLRAGESRSSCGGTPSAPSARPTPGCRRAGPPPRLASAPPDSPVSAFNPSPGLYAHRLRLPTRSPVPRTGPVDGPTWPEHLSTSTRLRRLMSESVMNGHVHAQVEQQVRRRESSASTPATVAGAPSTRVRPSSP